MQLPQRVPPEVRQRRDLRMTAGDLDLRLRVLDVDEDDHLVVRSLDEELEERVLVGRTQGGQRRRTGRARGPVLPECLTQALRPELLEPQRERAKPVRVRHQHVDAAVPRRVGVVQERGEQTRRILQELGRRAPLLHAGGPGEEAVGVDAADRGGKEPHGRQHAEASPTFSGTASAGIPSASLSLRSTPLAGSVVNRKCPRALSAPTDGLLHPLPRHQVLGHGLGRRPRLADHVEQRARGIDPLEKAPEGEGVGVVDDVQPREMVPLLGTELVPEGAQERVPERDGAEPRPPMPSTTTSSNH
jgi:hypothetical protein